MPVNLQFAYPNFAFDGSDFYNINHSANILVKKDTNGANLVTFPIVSNPFFDDLNNEIVALKFTGIRFELGINKGNANLWTLETPRNSDNTINSIKIRRFRLQNATLRYATTILAGGIERPDVFSYTSLSPYIFDTSSFAVEYYNTNITAPVSTGQSFVYLSNVTRLVPDSRLIIGPSTNTNNTGEVEERLVVSVGEFDEGLDGYRVDLDRPLLYNYNDNNEVTYQNYFYVFNNVNYGGDSDKGILYKFKVSNGAKVSQDSDVIYQNVSGAVFSENDGRIVFSKGNQLLYFNPVSLTYTNSVVMDNVDLDKNPALSIYDLAISQSFVYRLQTQESDFTNNILTNFGSYNYIRTPILPNVYSISVRPVEQELLANEFDRSYIDVTVYDQYGLPVEGQIVNIAALGLNGGEGVFLTFSSDDPQDQTNTTEKETRENGQVRFLYKSGPAQDIIKFTVTAQINDVQGFSYIYQYLNEIASGIIHQIVTLSSSNYLKQIVSISNRSILYLYKNFGFPNLRGTFHAGTESNAFRDMYDGLRDIDWAFWFADYTENNGAVGEHPVTNAKPALIKQEYIELTTESIIRQVHTIIDEVQIVQKGGALTDRSVLTQLTSIEGSAEITQYDFIILFIPEPFAVKIARSTNIYAKIRDIPGTNINVSTFEMFVNDVEVTESVDINYVANQYLEILYNPPVDFDFGERVYVLIRFYDQAPTPNLIEIYYYFDVIQDYKAPFIHTFTPMKGEVGIPTDSNISFYIHDEGVGVDIDTLLLYVNNIKINDYTVQLIGGDYFVEYVPEDEFKNTQDVSVYIEVQDNDGNKISENYNFITEPSSPPEIVMIRPYNCSYYTSRGSPVVFELYSTGDGVNIETVRLNINGEDKRFFVKNIVRRID